MIGHKHTLSREGGIEVVVYELATRMAARGYRVTCYDRRSRHVSGAALDNRREYEGVRIVPVWTIEKKGLAAFTSSVSATIKATFSDANVIHIHAEGPAAMCWLPHLFGKRVIVHVHGLDWAREKWKDSRGSGYIRFGEKMAVRFADEIIVLSKNIQDYFQREYGRRTVFIPNGVNRPQPRGADLIRSEWGLEKDSYVLFLGRIVPEKGLRYLMEAWKDIRTDKKLVVVGGSSDSLEFMNELKGMSPENVIFTGFQEGQILEELYSNSYIYVLPSDLEGMPLSLLEAMSYGNCCLVSDIPECSEVVEDHAVLFGHGDTGALKTALQDLLDDSAKVEEYRRDASDYICDKYDWNRAVDSVLGLYG